MIDYREVNALAKDHQRANDLAKELLGLQDTGWSEWETDFLGNMSGWRSELSTRQAEKLIVLREDGVLYDKVDGFSLKRLIDRCWTYRDERVRERDVEFVCRLKEQGAVKLRRRTACRLLACARTIGVGAAPRRAQTGRYFGGCIGGITSAAC